MMLYAIDAIVALTAGSLMWALTSRQRSTPRLPRLTPHRRNPLTAVAGVVGRLISRLRGANEDVRSTLIYTGSRVTAEEFLGIKVLLAVAAGVGCWGVLQRAGEMPWLFVGLAAGVGFFLPDLWLRARLHRRQQAMIKLLPDAIDLLSLCVNAGLDFMGALTRIVGVKEFQREPLVQELSVALQEMKLGKRRAEALKALARRASVPEISSFVRTIVQADRMGTSVAEVLAIHSEDIRLQRFTRAERAALKAPIKILIPLIFCIMPCVGIVVGAPIFLQFMRQNPFGR